MKKIIVLTTLFFLALMPSALAIGVSPSRIKTDFEAGESATFDFYVVNTRNEQVQVKIYAKGDLNESIDLQDEVLTLEAGGSKSSKFTVHYPSTLGPGKHDNRIGALEIASGESEGAAAVGAVSAVELQFWVYAPYEGKYLDASLDVPDVAAGETIDFTLKLTSRGTEGIDSASAKIRVYNSNGDLLKTLDSGSTSLSADGDTEELHADWSPGKLPAGTYSAVAAISYDGKNTEASSDFNIGDLFVKIKSVNIDDITAGSIGKAEIKVQSFWNEKITEAYATVELLSNGKTLKKFTGSVFEIPPQSSKTVEVFIDSEGLQKKQYSIVAKVHYSDKVAEKRGNLRITEPSALPSMTIIASVSILLLIIILAVVLYLWHKKGSSKEKKSRTASTGRRRREYYEQEEDL
ncbi:MAG: hypothetical protein R6U26_01100 [Candidatus Undinarchaeales archaeon]